MWTVRYQSKSLQDEGCIVEEHTFKTKQDALQCFAIAGAAMGHDMFLSVESARRIKYKHGHVTVSNAGNFPFLVFSKDEKAKQ